MHDKLLEKLQDIQLNGGGSASSTEVMALRAESEELRRKLKQARAEGGGNQGEELADAERRCAELMTKFVMAQQELETYKKHMKETTIRMKQRIMDLEAQCQSV